MKIGIIGLQSSGKTTMFETLVKESGQEIKYGTYGDERMKPHLGTIPVYDKRLEELARVFKPKKKTFSEITFIDRPGFDMVHAKECDALILVVGLFMGGDGSKDINDVEADMIVRDLDIIENKLKRLEKEPKAGESKDEAEYELLRKCKKPLEDGTPLNNMELTEKEKGVLHGYQFLTLKPMLVVLNVSESDIGKEPPPALKELLANKRLKFVEFCAEIELEIMDLKEDERPEFLKSLGIERPAREVLIKATFDMMNLITFYTVKGDETRAWSISAGTTALDAAGKVHTDIKRGFIRAEVVNFKDFIECGGSLQEAKAKGHHRLEGREYVVKDGDIIEFRFSV